ncbi:MAG: hypothetical protein ACE15E_10425 [Acidobacteriota bacterium]
MRKCPRCGGEGHRSQSRGFVERQILKRICIRPYRCRDCNTRFYRCSLGDHSKHRRLPLAGQGLKTEKQPDSLPRLVAQIREAEARLNEPNPKPGAGPAASPSE